MKIQVNNTKYNVADDDVMAVKVQTFATKHHITISEAVQILALQQQVTVSQGMCRMQQAIMGEIEIVGDSLLSLKRAFSRGDICVTTRKERVY